VRPLLAVKDILEMLADQMGRTKPTYILLLLVCIVLYFHLTFATRGDMSSMRDDLARQHAELQRQIGQTHDDVIKLQTMLIVSHPDLRAALGAIQNGNGS
jgi:hypothetical protein